ncbi:NEGR1 family protein [Megaselia abdita]
MRTISLLFVLFIRVYYVFGVPEIVSITDDTVVSEGDNVVFNCTVKDIGAHSLEWKKTNLESIDDSEVLLALRGTLNFADPRYTVNIFPKGDGVVIYRFSIKKIHASDMGYYICSINVSQKEKITSSVALSVKHSPVILDIRPFHVAEGQELEAVCEAYGYPIPTISWKRENDVIMPGGGRVLNGNTLMITKAHRLDGGNYFCIADNNIGEPVVRIVRINVEFAPVISVPCPKVFQAEGYLTKLECKVKGYPSVSISWYKSGVQLQGGEKYEILTTDNSYESTNSVLTISQVCNKDYGDYFCNATNKLGHVEARLNLWKWIVPIPF